MECGMPYLALVCLVGVAPAAQVRCEQLLADVFLGDDVVHWGFLGSGLDSVDGAER